MGQQSQKLAQRISQSRAQNDRVKSLLPQRAAPSLRTNFARCAIDLAQEHHSGLIRVAEAEEYGTAGALLRPILEASTAAFWLMYVANCDVIRALPTNAVEDATADIPMLGDMAKALIPTFPPIQTIVDGLKKGGRAKWLHKYTHGGTPQLTRRNSGWREDERMLILIRADLFGILAACLETVIASNPALSAYAFGRRDELSDEMHIRFSTPKVHQQPHSLPAPLTEGCGPPFR
ncbi:DUF6988 family protein [Oleiagrimonas soli]|uniref:Uncharacterized protein n=2 Tax=Oleiagrimonas soli TaxID=1543381 RepID=A0A841KP12_9GAMM|nr:hypothetical protein [Oleiagrimonas soli]